MEVGRRDQAVIPRLMIIFRKPRWIAPNRQPMRKEGSRLIIEPAPPKSLLAVLAMLAPLDEEFPPIPDPLPGPVEL
jgi:hypothetical protein